MAISFKLVARKNPQNPAAAPLYYAQATSNGKRDLKSLAVDVARHTTMSVADVHGVLLALQEEIIVALKEGSIVELGDLCSFYPTVYSEGVANPDEFKANVHIRQKGINVRPRQVLSKQMHDITVHRVE